MIFIQLIKNINIIYIIYLYNHEGIRDFIISCLNVKVVGYNNLALGYLLLIIYVNVPKPSTSPNYLAYYP